MEFELDLMEYLRSIYINCSLCAQNCIRSCTVDERAGPALKIPSVWQRYVLWEDLLWSHGKLWFCISGWEEKEQNVTEESRWCEQRGMQTALIVHEITECLFSKHIFAFGSCHWNFWDTNSEGSCVHFGGDFDWKRHSHRLKDGLHSAGLILPAWGRELEAVEARAWSCWGEGWGCARGWFSPWICWNKKESQTWSV